MPLPGVTAREPHNLRTVALEAVGTLRQKVLIRPHIDDRLSCFRGAQGEVEVITVVGVVAAHVEAPVPGAEALRVVAAMTFAVEYQLQHEGSTIHPLATAAGGYPTQRTQRPKGAGSWDGTD
jgi:hypothetical protein